MVKPAVDSSKAEPARIGYIGASRWFDERDRSQIIDKHVIKAEIDCLERKIKELEATGYGGDIYVISPFKSIASYCKNLFSKNKNVLCGTIHTFQVKEADVVFLILGSDPNVESSRKWASEKPNMLNVALTRAKKRFYVIGNKELWASCTYFETMAKVLK